MDDTYTDETSVYVTYPIVGGLYTAEKFIENLMEFENWKSVNDIQRWFLTSIYDMCRQELPSIPELESIANNDVEVINKWLKKHGFSIQLEPIPPDGIASACKLDLAGYWQHTGSSTQFIAYDGERYPCIKMFEGYVLLDSDEVEEHIVKLVTETNDEVYMVMVDKVPSGMEMIEYAEKIHNNLEPADNRYDGLLFPMIDLDLESSLDWLITLRGVVNNPAIPFYEIIEALQQTKLKMNHKGFRIKSAVAIGIVAKGPPSRKVPYVINKPFLMWIQRPGLNKPLLVGYFNTDVWKDPSGLEM